VDIYRKQKQVGQGTYGSVFVGAHKVTGEIVALKRINTEQEENGFPITAIREVKILKALCHENIVELKEIVTSKGKFYLLRGAGCFPGFDHFHLGGSQFRAHSHSRNGVSCSSNRRDWGHGYYHGSFVFLRVCSV